MKLRVISRVIIYNKNKDKIILVRNRNANFWYVPGGGWEYEKENILEAGKREIKEEVGIDIDVDRLLYVQEFQESKDRKYFETFWLSFYDGEINQNHIDLDPNGMVEEVKWFSKDELKEIKIFPKELKDRFWKEIKNIKNYEDPFIGID